MFDPLDTDIAGEGDAHETALSHGDQQYTDLENGQTVIESTWQGQRRKSAQRQEFWLAEEERGDQNGAYG